MIHLYIVIATLLCVAFETWRIKKNHGKVVNVDKRYTRLFAGVLFCGVFALCQTWIHGFWCSAIAIAMYVGCRGLFYDPLLNVFALKRKWWQDSTTTNSKTDDQEQRLKINTYMQRAYYGSAWILTSALYELIIYFTK